MRLLKNKILPLVLAALLLLASFIFWPEIDLAVSGWFYAPGKGFHCAGHPFFLFMENLAFYGSRALGFILALLALITALRRKPVWKIDAKAWLLLWLALVLGAWLIVNTGFKDHWGRARPREVTEFAGHATFSAPLVPQFVTHPNGSFVSGDAAFGFYLPSFAYVVPRRSPKDPKQKRSRHFFWGGMMAGALFGLSRLALGAHFLSDVLFAAFFMLAVSAALHAVMYGRRETAMYWRDWFFDELKLGK